MANQPLHCSKVVVAIEQSPYFFESYHVLIQFTNFLVLADQGDIINIRAIQSFKSFKFCNLMANQPFQL